MLSFKVPFGRQDKTQASPKLELRMDSIQSQIDRGYFKPKSVVYKRPALMEWQFDQSGINGLKVGGQSIALDDDIYGVNGLTDDQKVQLIVVGVLVALLIATLFLTATCCDLD